MSQLLLPLIVACFALPVFADHHEATDSKHEEADHSHAATDSLAPAHRYDANMPVDLGNGRIGNNGTTGKANPEYEALREAELAAPGVFAAPYPYSAKKSFVASIKDRLRFFEEAIVNLKEGNMNNKQEVAEFGSKAAPQIEEKLEAARKALKSAGSAGEKDWSNAEHEARTAFLNLKSTYEGMMRTSAQPK